MGIRFKKQFVFLLVVIPLLIIGFIISEGHCKRDSSGETRECKKQIKEEKTESPKEATGVEKLKVNIRGVEEENSLDLLDLTMVNEEAIISRFKEQSKMDKDYFNKILTELEEMIKKSRDKKIMFK